MNVKFETVNFGLEIILYEKKLVIKQIIITHHNELKIERHYAQKMF